MTETTFISASYDVRLTLSGIPTGAAEEVRQMIAQALGVPGGQVSVESVLEVRPPEEGWITERVVSLDALFAALPGEHQTSAIRTSLAAHYYRELSCLWRSVCDPRCVRGAVELRLWRQAGPQWICEFLSFDQGAPKGNECNWHFQNTSQWQNRQTGWVGHQGAIVLDAETGDLSAHH